jgi:hypothetical protein
MTYQDGYELNLNNDTEEIESQVEWYSSDILLGGFKSNDV